MTGNAVILDCSSLDTALQSIGALLGIDADDFRRALRSASVDWDHKTVAPEDQLIRAFGYRDKRALPEPAGVRWFHATRALAGTSFDEGILPTMDAWSSLWGSLGVIASQWLTPSEWAGYRRSFERGDRRFSQQFQRKQIVPGWEGPFAFLVRDAAIGRCGDHKDFTKMPETVEDICADFEEVMGHPLCAAYEAATRPCLVMFTSPGTRYGVVGAGLNYAHRCVCELEHSFACNAVYVGGGVGVPASRIERIEWLPQSYRDEMAAARLSRRGQWV